MNKEELIGKLNMIYVGDKNTLDEMVGYYDGLKEVTKLVQQENKQLKQRIDETIEYLETATIDPQSMRHYRNCLLEILEGNCKDEN